MSEQNSQSPNAPDLEQNWPKDPSTIIQLCAQGIEYQGMRVGIYGAEVCQSCGQIGTFSGWASAMSHHAGGHEFICGCCWRDADRLQRNPAQVGMSMAALGSVRSRINQRPDRYCEICRAQVNMEQGHKVDRHWLCEPCRALIQEQHPGLTAEQVLRNLIRERYLWWTCRSMADLQAFRERLELMRLVLGGRMRDPTSGPV